MRGAMIALMFFCCGMTAYADGTVFVSGAAKPRIPDQSALITFDGKTERLVIETGIEGAGTEFAWVVPVPSLPKVEAATTGLFPTLRAITRARVVGYESNWMFLPALLALFGVMIWWAILRRGWIAPMVTYVILVILSGLLLPAGGSRGGRAMMSHSIAVLDRKIAGCYETVTISGTDGKKIGEWLNGNGFNVPASKQAALEQYAKEGWVFVAGRIRRDLHESEQFNAHPLSFTFATKRAVYPMRLTGIENGPVTVDLYAVGNGEAASAQFTRERAGRLDFDVKGNRDRFNYEGDRDDFIPLSHESLQTYCKGFSALTVLSATLSPAQMKDDLYLMWKPLSPFRHVLYLRGSALDLASSIAAVTFVLLSLACAARYRRRYQGGLGAWKRALAAAGILAGTVGIVSGLGETLDSSLFFGIIWMVCSLAILIVACNRAMAYDRQWRERPQPEATPQPLPSILVVTIAILAPILVAICVYSALPKASGTQVIMLRWSPSERSEMAHKSNFASLNNAKPEGDPAAVLAACREYAASFGSQENPFTGLPCIEEDSPGNYVIDLKNGKPTYFYFDDAGKKIELGVIGEQGHR